jgi:hypothetical protein
MGGGLDIQQPDVRHPRRAAAVRIAGALLVATLLAGCDRCGDLAFRSIDVCRQEAPKQR